MKQAIGNTKTIDAVNILLIFISLVAAFKVPFHLFLFSYAVLGPLHYLTELSWLRDRDYFITQRKWAWSFIIIAIIITVPFLYAMQDLPIGRDNMLGHVMQLYGMHLFFGLLFLSFTLAVSLIYLKKWQHTVMVLVGSVCLAVFLAATDRFDVITMSMLFLPTIIHVYLFTFLFMLYGTVKTRNMAGIIACICLVLVPFIIATVVIDAPSYRLDPGMEAAFFKSDLQKVNGTIAKMLGGLEANGTFFIGSDAGIRIQIFVAFCYTYHYLNWFSKTGVIGWNKGLTVKRSIVIVAIWLIAVALYKYDYRVGLAALATLSLAHVLCELPLNVLSVRGIFTELRTRAGSKSA